MSLRRAFQNGYTDLKARLARQLGSPELAAEALHETWLKIEKLDATATVENPGAYVYRAALNTAFNLKKAETRRRRNRDDSSFAEEPDHSPGPDQIASAREEWQIVLEALAELTVRQREVFRVTFTEDIGLPELARRHGVSTRTIQNDLYLAINHCRKRLLSKSRFAKLPAKLSED